MCCATFDAPHLGDHSILYQTEKGTECGLGIMSVTLPAVYHNCMRCKDNASASRTLLGIDKYEDGHVYDRTRLNSTTAYADVVI